jgi:hypothetical protein
MGTVFGYAAVQSPYEIVIAPSANACFPIGRDVRRIDGSERQFEWQSAGERISAGRSGAAQSAARARYSPRHQLRQGRRQPDISGSRSVSAGKRLNRQ